MLRVRNGAGGRGREQGRGDYGGSDDKWAFHPLTVRTTWLERDRIASAARATSAWPVPAGPSTPTVGSSAAPPCAAPVSDGGPVELLAGLVEPLGHRARSHEFSITAAEVGS